MNKIGFRVKASNLGTFIDDLENYYKIYNALELKIIPEAIDENFISDIINSVINIGDVSFSIHSFANALYNVENYEANLKLMNFFEKFYLKLPINIVLHYIDDSFKIIQPVNNVQLLIENIEVESNFEEYIRGLKNCAIKNYAGICLDLGHLFYSCMKCNKNPEEVLNIFMQDEWWKLNIKEFHIHDYNKNSCHLILGNGLMDFEIIKPILNMFSDLPIIIESKLNLVKSGEMVRNYLVSKI